MTQPVSSTPPQRLPSISLPSNAKTVDGLLQREQFGNNSQAVKAGGQASLINVQKDVDTLLKTGGKGVTQDDLKNDLKATGLSDSDAKNQAMSLIAAATNSDTIELQNELASLFQKQGGLSADHSQGLADQFLGLENNHLNPNNYQNDVQISHGGTPVPPRPESAVYLPAQGLPPAPPPPPPAPSPGAAELPYGASGD